MKPNKKYILLFLAIFAFAVGCSKKDDGGNGTGQTQKTNQELLQDLRNRFQPPVADPPLVSGPISTLNITCQDGFSRNYSNYNVSFDLDTKSFTFGEGPDAFILRNPAFTPISTAFIGNLTVVDYASLVPTDGGPLFAATVTGLTIISTSVYSLVLSEEALSTSWVYAELHITTTEHGDCQADLSSQFNQVIS